jgi:hypothetical protein
VIRPAAVHAKVTAMTDEMFVDQAATSGHSAKASLQELLTFERLLADLSARFANVSSDLLETEIVDALTRSWGFWILIAATSANSPPMAGPIFYVRWR